MSAHHDHDHHHDHHHDHPEEDPTSPPSDNWKHTGVRVIPADELDNNTTQTPGMSRAAAITQARVGAQKLWGKFVLLSSDCMLQPRGVPWTGKHTTMYN